MAQHRITRTKANRWCEIEIRLENGRLSICGAEGSIISRAKAKKEAFGYWRSFFEEDREQLGRMAIDYGKRTPATAARYVLQVDGEFHGLDVHAEVNGKVYLTESCGQIRETLAEFFPEAAPYFAWHLNDMHAGTEAQEAGLAKHKWDGMGSHYNWACAVLEDNGLLIDHGYKYGSSWLKRPLPAEVVAWFNSLPGSLKEAA